MSCDRFRDDLVPYYAGELDAERAEQLEDHVESCGACGAILADMQGFEEDLLLAATLPAPAVEPRATARPRASTWRLWIAPALAAGLLIAALVGRSPQTAPPGAEVPLAAALPDVPLKTPLRFQKRASLRLPDGSLVAADAGALLELTGPRSLALREGTAAFDVAKHHTPFTVLTPRGTARVLGTTFRLEIDMKPAAKAAAAVTVVTLAVASGVVLFEPDEGDVLRVEAGQTAVAGPDGADLLDTPAAPADAEVSSAALDEQTAELEAKKQALDAEVAQLKEQLAAAKTQIDELQASIAAKGDSALKKKTLAVNYGRWSESDLLKDADWKEMGGAFKVMLETMPELYEVLRKGEKPSTELAVKFSRENTKLMKFAIEAMGRLPTNAGDTGNGAFTHPIVTSNLLVEHMEQAGEPLSEAQLWSLHQLGAEYDAGWDAAQSGYTEATLTLQKVVDELELKLAFYDGMTGMLTPAQRQLVVTPEFQHVTGIDIYSPVLMLSGVAQASNAKTLEVMKANLINTASDWGFAEADLQAQGIVFDTWISDLGELTPVPVGTPPFFDVHQAMRSAKAQLKAMQELQVRLAPDTATQKTLRDAAGFTVPRLLAE